MNVRTRLGLAGCWGAAALLFIAPVNARAQAGPGGPVAGRGFRGPGGAGPDDALGFVGFESGLGGKTVTGAPFTADFSTETTQTLPDGNTIDRKTTGSFARDGQGRTRRELTLPAIGAYATSGDDGAPPRGIVINDPVAGVSYVLNENSKKAREMRLPLNPFRGTGGPGAGGIRSANAPDVTTTSLGTQTIGGVVAEGTRTVRTIPAGQIGNTKPIDLSVERWHSAELQTDVLIKRSDPRGGQTVFQLTNIQRGEPDGALFQVPSDYIVVQGRVPARPGGPRRGMNPPAAQQP